MSHCADANVSNPACANPSAWDKIINTYHIPMVNGNGSGGWTDTATPTQHDTNNQLKNLITVLFES
jgi:hypothetical protein